jgi:hypothetical protein
MPALFAYLIAVALLLGGGYGALTWLAAPEPVKMAVKANVKAKPKPSAREDEKSEREDEKSEARSADINSPAIPDGESEASGSAASGSNENPPPQNLPLQNAPTNVAAAHAEVHQSAEAESTTAPVASLASRQAAVSSPSAVAKTMKRRQPRQADGRSEKSALTLMRLRTIEFPDGRRVTQLIPYRSARPVEFEREPPDW